MTVSINPASSVAQSAVDTQNTVTASAESAVTAAVPLATALQNTITTAIDDVVTVSVAAPVESAWAKFWAFFLMALAPALGAGVIAFINWFFLKKEAKINQQFMTEQTARGEKYDSDKHRREIADQFCI